MTAVVSRERALDDLMGTECKGCGGTKKPRMSHCRSCYFALPAGMRRSLYLLIGNGYEQAYTESLEWLAKHRAGAQ